MRFVTVPLVQFRALDGNPWSFQPQSRNLIRHLWQLLSPFVSPGVPQDGRARVHIPQIVYPRLPATVRPRSHAAIGHAESPDSWWVLNEGVGTFLLLGSQSGMEEYLKVALCSPRACRSIPSPFSWWLFSPRACITYRPSLLYTSISHTLS